MCVSAIYATGQTTIDGRAGKGGRDYLEVLEIRRGHRGVFTRCAPTRTGQPFDYYFHAANPRVAVPGWNPSAARKTIADTVARAGGGWLVSLKAAPDARVELPDAGGFRIKQVVDDNLVALYRIEPVASALH